MEPDSRNVVRIIVPEIPVTTTPFSNVTTANGDVGVVSENLYDDPGDWRYFAFAIGLLVIVLGTVGNGITVWAYGRNRNLQTSFNVLIANLCCVELLFSIVIIPLQLPGYIINMQPYPDAVCSVVGFFYYSSMAASLQNLVAIAINRYVGIVDTKRYQTLFTGARLRLCVISIWVLAPLLYLPLVIGGVIIWRKDSARCAILTSGGSTGIQIYNLILNIIFQAGGLILLVVLYSAIIKKVKEVQKKLKTHKRSSFTSSKSEKKSKNKIPKVRTPGTTSGEETPDEYRPSSLISGGFQFRPVKDDKNHNPSISTHPSDHELTSHRSKRASEHTNSHASFVTASPDPSPKHRKRYSLWQVLFRNKATQGEPSVEGEAAAELKTHDETTNDPSQEAVTPDPDMPTPSQDMTTPSQDMVTPSNDTDVVKTDGVPMRSDSRQIREMRRKKSLSAPTLPSLEEIINQSRKNSAAVAKNIPEQVKEVNEVTTPEISPRLSRAFTIGSKYLKNPSSSIRLSAHTRDRYSGANRMDLLSASSFTRLGASTNKSLHTSMPTLVPMGLTDSATPKHTRVGTIARKIREHRKSKKVRNNRSRERQRALRKRHARERQLVYSSLTICIAFAICILPTSLLHVLQVIFDLRVHAAVTLVVGCISWLHAVVNPFIYGYMNHLYRKEYAHIAKEFEQKIEGCFR